MIRPYREELKFVIHHSVKTALLERWSPYLVKAPFTNQHGVTPILSQYYDSPFLDFFYEKLDGIADRNKVRLRVYDLEFKAGTTAFLEIKQRHNALVRKYRHQIVDFHPGHLDPLTWTFDREKEEAAFRTLQERYLLRASAQTYYQREAFEGAAEKDVRITVDTNLIAMFPGERLSRVKRDPSRRVIPDTLSILEVKADHGRIPNWLRDGVLACELQQQTVPKYVAAVQVLGLDELTATGVYA